MPREDADNQDMSDLSRLLDDVYGTTSETSTSTPGWATETAKVFTGWLPDAAPAPVEREPEVVADPVDALERILEQSAPVIVAAPAPEPEPVPEPQPLRAWRPEDDDILPARASRRRLTLRRR